MNCHDQARAIHPNLAQAMDWVRFFFHDARDPNENAYHHLQSLAEAHSLMAVANSPCRLRAIADYTERRIEAVMLVYGIRPGA